MIELSHDPFARTSLVRRLVVTGQKCFWCGQSRRGDALFQYGTERDDRPGETHVGWHKGLFCSKSCHDSYHG